MIPDITYMIKQWSQASHCSLFEKYRKAPTNIDSKVPRREKMRKSNLGILFRKHQWSFLVPLIGGRSYIITHLAIYLSGM